MSKYALTEEVERLLDCHVNERGINAMVRCPLHEDRRPSLSIHLEDGVFHCFSCGESGSLERLYALTGTRMSSDLYIYRARKRAEDPGDEVFNPGFTSMADEFHENLIAKGSSGKKAALDFIESRGLSRGIVREFRIGWNPKNHALSFPYINKDGIVTGIKYRHADGFKTSETGSKYGIYNALGAVGRDEVLVCEGESDTLSTWSKYGDKYAVCGTSGASISEGQWSLFSIDLFFAQRIYILHDADEAGDTCAENARRVFGDDRCVRLRPPEGTDVSEYYMSGGTLEELGL